MQSRLEILVFVSLIVLNLLAAPLWYNFGKVGNVYIHMCVCINTYRQYLFLSLFLIKKRYIYITCVQSLFSFFSLVDGLNYLVPFSTG